MKISVCWELDAGDISPPNVVDVPPRIFVGMDNASICKFLADTWGFLVQNWEVYQPPEEGEKSEEHEDSEEEEAEAEAPVIYEDLMKEYNLEGKVIASVEGLEVGSGKVRFGFHDGTFLKLYHAQECCECVELEDFEDIEPHELIGARLVSFEKATKEGDSSLWGIKAWTFYKVRTTSMDTTLRWYGESNGYYSIGVSVQAGDPEDEW